MHLFVTLVSEKGVELPVHYNYLLQAAIYGTIDPELAAFLHDTGYQSGSRRFKLFAFSRVNGKFAVNKEKNTLRFTGDSGRFCPLSEVFGGHAYFMSQDAVKACLYDGIWGLFRLMMQRRVRQ